MKTISFYQNTVPIANILLSVNIDEVIIYELRSTVLFPVQNKHR